MLARRPDSLPIDNAYTRRLKLYRGEIRPEEVFRPADTADGRTNLFGALARTMAKTGYRDLKEFQRVDLVLGGRSD